MISNIKSVSHLLLCLQSADYVKIDYIMHAGTQYLWHEHVKSDI